MTHFLGLASVAVAFLWLFWMIAIPLALASILALSLWLRRRPRRRIPPTFLLGCLVFAFGMLLYGTLQARAGGQPQPLAWIAPYFLYAMLLAQVTLSILFMVRTPAGTRFLLSVVLMWELLLSYCAGLTALMSVSGRWL